MNMLEKNINLVAEITAAEILKKKKISTTTTTTTTATTKNG